MFSTISHAIFRVSAEGVGFETPIISLFFCSGIPSKCQTTSNRNQFFAGIVVPFPEAGNPYHPIVSISGSRLCPFR